MASQGKRRLPDSCNSDCSFRHSSSDQRMKKHPAARLGMEARDNATDCCLTDNNNPAGLARIHSIHSQNVVGQARGQQC